MRVLVEDDAELQAGLHALFVQLDSLYFAGQLQLEGWRVFYGLINDNDDTSLEQQDGDDEPAIPWTEGICYSQSFLIVIDPFLTSERDLLLHEMCHAISSGEHGRAWQRTMLRLIVRGEDQLLPELEAELPPAILECWIRLRRRRPAR